MIERSGCTDKIDVCRDGKQALEYVTACIENKTALPDLIFLDINMPVMNGWEFLEKFSTLHNGEPGGSVVVMLTTSLNPDDRARAEQYPEVRSFAYKPLTESTLNGLLEEFFAEGE